MTIFSQKEDEVWTIYWRKFFKIFKIAEKEERERTLKMLKYFKSSNIDFEIVGIYKTYMYGTGFDRDLFYELQDTRAKNPDAIVLIYGSSNNF